MINLYLILPIVIVLGISIIAYIKKYKKIRKKYGDLWSFLTGAILAIISVVVGIFFLNLYEDGRERNQASQLLQRAQEELMHCYENVDAVREVMAKEIDLDTTISDFFSVNPIQKPRMFLSIIDKDVVLSHINFEIVESFFMAKENINSISNQINSAVVKNAICKSYLNAYLSELWYCREICLLSIRFIKMEIDSVELDSEKQVLIRNRLSFMGLDYNKTIKIYPKGNFDLKQLIDPSKK